MKRLLLLFGLIAALFPPLGCQPGSTQDAVASAPDILGRWYGKAGEVKQADEATRKILATMGDSVAELYFTPDGKFTLRMMGTPIEGSYTQVENKVTLKFESVMGMKFGDDKSPMAFMGDAFKEPQTGEVKDGGKTIFLRARPGLPGEADMTFTREPPEEAPPGPRSVNEDESKHVGVYVYDDSFEPPKAATKAEESARAMMQMMIRSVRLELREDNAFTFTMMMPMKGKWRVEKGAIKLNVMEPDLGKAMGEKPPEITVRPSGKPGQLEMLNDKTGKVDFLLKRE